MRLRLRSGILVIGVCLAMTFHVTSAAAEITPTPETIECASHLRLISEAIREHLLREGKYPDELSLLTPKYLADPELLFCPVFNRTGVSSDEVTGIKKIENPDSASSYTYELSSLKTSQTLGAGGNDVTMREWKLRQSLLVGPKVPMVRCHLHDNDASINVGFDGSVFNSPRTWELMFTNRVSLDALGPSKVFQHLERVANPVRTGSSPVRLHPSVVNLSLLYNADPSVLRPPEELVRSVNQIDSDLVMLAGTFFESRGLVVMPSGDLEAGDSSAPSIKIEVDRICSELLLLCGAPFEASQNSPKGRMQVLRSDGRESNVLIGATPDMPFVRAPHPYGRVAAPGSDSSHGEELWIQLFQFRWINPSPDEPVLSVTIFPFNKESSLFLIALAAIPDSRE